MAAQPPGELLLSARVWIRPVSSTVPMPNCAASVFSLQPLTAAIRRVTYRREGLLGSRLITPPTMPL